MSFTPCMLLNFWISLDSKITLLITLEISDRSFWRCLTFCEKMAVAVLMKMNNIFQSKCGFYRCTRLKTFSNNICSMVFPIWTNPNVVNWNF